MNEKEIIFNKCKKIINKIIIKRMIRYNIIQVILICLQLFVFIPTVTNKVCIAICVFMTWVAIMILISNINRLINIRSKLIAKTRREIECGNIILTEKGTIHIKPETYKFIDE